MPDQSSGLKLSSNQTAQGLAGGHCLSDQLAVAAGTDIYG
jgi:hypothetical protein